MKTDITAIHRVCRLPEYFWQQLTQAPWQFDLFQTLRRIDAQAGGYYRLGTAPLPHYELLRLGQKASMAFAPSTISTVHQLKNSKLYEVLIYSFGLFGPNGPLPLHLTEYTYSREYNYQDPTLGAFTNLFHHRLILLFYRAWANAQPTSSLDRPDNQKFCHYLACLIGMGLSAQQNSNPVNHDNIIRNSINNHARYALSGHLSRQRHNAEGLKKIMLFYFKVPVKIIQNIPQWLQIETQDQARLAAGRHVPCLGKSAILGIAIHDIQHKFRIELGPLTQAEYDMFLPEQTKSQQVREWVYQYLGIEYGWDIRLILDKSDITEMRLSKTGKLGLNSWLGKVNKSSHYDDLIYNPESCKTH
ncbi:type VI secretion system baseplate subunit TssG [Xenorhabdus bovienii]|uniref:type VI secretion system baseplate subunit TssG n=1 Tax=Xenorhabdus bovienii TaxID=40576 RepID=UPI0023B2DC46|nr:type VI secretion system baseplate subunit TssG [Xenorhabdus bovienii]MDE9455351.1 type VI secretion system baseplate subunit TssG [Xenorhabdus bovienii]MDE9483385.1 type VI secretion system baseplate subunit TssG [Xenorhabdus bovienii]MDE9544654.1 type VI secretion system baseplate subunit TssG [Xenorhabdus bovienii]MDE9552825.1 type VI secretion system baseplate subunit TssG [Xenorhabdus bovienii]MDE9557388.1 type VI secretion system baseplate subunit TssG [Xenorhabdus bovienii]